MLTIFRWNIIDLAIAVLGLLLTCLEVVMQVHRNLHPAFYLSSSIVKIIMWTVSIGLAVAAMFSDWVKWERFNRDYLYATIGATILV